jgi:DNA-binding response OmpR family regulator
MRHIIFVDDDPGIQESMKIVLKKLGYSVTVYASGKTLLYEFFEVPALFILDKQLSGIDGLAICRYLKDQASTKNVPVIVLSASPMVEKLAAAAGADGFLEKPFKMQMLKSMIDSLLDPDA